MKKFFALAAIAFAAIAMVSCEKNPDNNKINDDENGTSVRKVLLALPSAIDEDNNFLKGRMFRYDENGVLVGVDETYEQDGEYLTWNLNITRDGNKLTFTEEDGSVWNEWTINEQGYVTERAEGESVYYYEYDAEGHLTKVYEDWNNTGKSLQSVCTWEDGNMTSWTREGDAEDGSGGPRIKRQTYTEYPNVGGIFTVFTEKGGMKKWMFEAGFFGKSTKNLVKTDKWDDREAGATFDYRFDSDDYVIAEQKFWDGELDDETFYFWKDAE